MKAIDASCAPEEIQCRSFIASMPLKHMALDSEHFRSSRSFESALLPIGRQFVCQFQLLLYASPLLADLRAALKLLDQQKAGLYINVQGNLGALLLGSDHPEAAVAELQQAIALAQRLQQPLHQYAGILFNLGKAFTTVGNLSKAEDTYAEAASAAYAHDFASYSKALAAKRSIDSAAAEQAAQVATLARQYFSKTPKLGFLKDVQLATVSSQTTDPKLQQQEWIQQADSVELVWLHFALFNSYHRNK